MCPTRGVLAGRYRVKRRRPLRPVRFRLRAARTPHRGHAVRGHRAGGDGGDTWQFAAQDRIRSRPAIADGTVFFGSLGKSVYAVYAATGDKKWSLADSLNGIVHAVDAASGGRRWSVRTGLP
ncbi:PQQ-binding-like beta-propeller repeat protein [Streptoverticillium reticulum]|uniref:outer membrane protein assembly factor BamB family protein n=1 Tax=Streptoverticillium reticulum TaxID=1433415 RepID=UPI0039BEFCBD